MKRLRYLLRRILPRPMITRLKQTYYYPIDVLDQLLGRRDELMPPMSLSHYVGEPHVFLKERETYFMHFIESGGLKSTDKVLEVGCGVGRIAGGLTRYLRNGGAYEGIDIVPAGIKWARENITSKHPNFHFQVADVFNKGYNPKGAHKASEYKFPFPDETFDFIYLTSVFTHMMQPDIENYLSEIARVLKKGGKSFITYLLLNEESLRMLDPCYIYSGPGYRTINEKTPEDSIAFDEPLIRNLYPKYGLKIIEPILYGAWCGRKAEYALPPQDAILAVKS
jgi:ubiquinone/menaquinone biosynthesis C-methylase UbiE